MPIKEYTNRLINEKSPYLLQHAHNPVDWYPWGDEAFEKAKAEDKPVFVSIGYSTCHWCHVMERESFEDAEVADILNKNFVSIKVDREERPDIDAFYMSACTALNGSGGWPLNCFLTADKKPFFAGTYFPKNDRYGMPGLTTLLKQVAALWKTKRNELLSASASVLGHIAENEREKRTALRENPEADAFAQLSVSFDSVYGGFGTAPKFPSLHSLLFLMRYAQAHKEPSALEMVRKTLEGMGKGGIRDHIGGGFCRYSTDGQWLVPHFEKMLYDNALCLLTYAEAGALFHEDIFKDIARETANFCLREMCDDTGGFYTAIDADSEGVEGKSILFTPDEVTEAIGKDDGARWCRLYGITQAGNFEGKNIPHLQELYLSESERSFVKEANARLLKYRNRRIQPFRDEKILTSTNGLMIAAFSAAGRMMQDSSLIEAAEKCAAFILRGLHTSGRLKARYRGGDAAIPPTCEDYAFLIWGLIELYESTYRPAVLREAHMLQEEQDRLFWDTRRGGYYLSGNDRSDLPVRQKEFHDGAIPSGNSGAAMNLLRLARLTGEAQYEDRMHAVIEAAASEISGYPSGFCWMLSALLFAKTQANELVLVSGPGLTELLGALPRYAPFLSVTVCGKGFEEIAEISPFLKNYPAVNSRAAAYLCKGGSCKAPVTEPDALRALLRDAAANIGSVQ